MATSKAYTDIEQSHKLAEILPVESADMYWSRCTITDFDDDVLKVSYAVEPCNISQFRNTKEDVPCWSLASLLGVLPSVIKRNGKRMFLTLEKAGAYNLYYKSPDRLDELWETKEEALDACYEMILKLHEQKIL